MMNVVHVHLRTSEKDEASFAVIAAAHGMSVRQMLEKFISDSVQGMKSPIYDTHKRAAEYTKAVKRHNQDGTLKFSVYFLEARDNDEMLPKNMNPKREYRESDFKRDFSKSWQKYLAYCRANKEKPETMSQAAADMKTFAQTYCQYFERRTSANYGYGVEIM